MSGSAGLVGVPDDPGAWACTGAGPVPGAVPVPGEAPPPAGGAGTVVPAPPPTMSRISAGVGIPFRRVGWAIATSVASASGRSRAWISNFRRSAVSITVAWMY